MHILKDWYVQYAYLALVGIILLVFILCIVPAAIVGFVHSCVRLSAPGTSLIPPKQNAHAYDRPKIRGS